MAIEITSPQNPRIKEVIRLRDRRGRRRQERFIIDGIRELRRAIDSEFEILEVFYDEAMVQDPKISQLLNTATDLDAELIGVPERVMEKLSYGQRVLPLIAIAQTPVPISLEDLSPSNNTLIIILEALEKPGNLGAILRTADASGVDAVIISDGNKDLFNPNTIRSSCGAVFHLPVISTSHKELITWLDGHAFQSFATRIDGAVDYTQVDYTGKTALVMGTEATGLSERWNNENSIAISIPMQGIGDSLNVSTSCAVVCYEALRQRRSS